MRRCQNTPNRNLEQKEPCNPRQPDRHEVVTHVPGTIRYPCLRAGQRILMVKNTDYGQSIILMGKWLREGTTRTAKRWAIGSSGVATALQKKARTTLFHTDEPKANVFA